MIFISKVAGSFPGRSGGVFLSILYVLNNALKAKKIRLEIRLLVPSLCQLLVLLRSPVHFLNILRLFFLSILHVPVNA